jgi:hypothetical protein
MLPNEHNRPFHVVITVSAIWQDYAVQRIKLALNQASILAKRPGCANNTHTFVSEPEAAALAVIEGHKKYDTLKPGETFVIADLGGGTVVRNIIIAYFILQGFFLIIYNYRTLSALESMLSDPNSLLKRLLKVKVHFVVPCFSTKPS